MPEFTALISGLSFTECDRVMLFHTNRGGILHDLTAGASLIFDGICHRWVFARKLSGTGDTV
jgi:hypothetical protein